ncbi:MAG: polysaccharide biosynthesis tyrosine autokinase [Patulibacter sp.]|nr:polysaccharide biosynthesis tyrosine autokinase [Patulibacter sp.]
MTSIDRWQRPRNAGDATPSPVLRALRQNWLLFVTFPLLAAAMGYVLATSQTNKYTSTSALLFREYNFSQQLFGSSYTAPSRDPDREAATNVRLVSLRSVAVRTSEVLSGELSPQEISRMVTIAAQGESSIVTVSAESNDPKEAAQVANTFAKEYVESRRNADRAKLREASNLIRDRLRDEDEGSSVPGAETLRTLNDQLQVMLTLQLGNAEVVQTASVPTEPSSPKPKRSAALAFLLGLILAGAVTAVRSQFDRRIRDQSEFESVTGWPILASISRSSELAEAQPGLSSLSPVSERFRLLRARLRYFNVDKEIRSLLITSAHAGEGKSTVALHLAAAYAQAGARVVIVESDLRRPTLADRTRCRRVPGLAELISERLDDADAIQRVEFRDSDGAGLDLIAAGATPPNPSALLESSAMGDLLTRLTSTYDLVIVDTPPATVVSDAIPLLNAVDGVIVVSNLRILPRDEARDLGVELERLRAPVLGAVINGRDERERQYYGYEAPGSGKDPRSPAAVEGSRA